MENQSSNGTVRAMKGVCPDCGSDTKSNLYRHLFDVHSYSKDDIEAMKKQKRTQKLLSVANEVYECDVCGINYQSRRALEKHKRNKAHINEEETVYLQREILCSTCEERVKDHWQLINHVNEDHATMDKQYIVEMATFDDKAAFEHDNQGWKNQLENDTVTRFAVVSRRKLADGYVTYMRCSRAKPSQAYGEIARSGSKKVVDSCTAFMKVTESGNNLGVKFCRSHCGHEVEPAALTIDPSSEQYIVSLLKEGFRPHQILKKIRDKCRDNDKHLRLYYTSYSDIRLIGIRNKVDPSRKDDVDIKSVEMRVQEKVADDGIRFYNPAVNETGEGFSLVIITPLQQSWLAAYGIRAICMDDTFNLTAYCLRLATVVVIDEWGRGLPAAYLLSNRMTENEVATMFEEVRRLLPNFDTEFFMSDDCNAFYNGFVKVFPQTKARKLLCSFHVVQAIKRSCNTKLKQKQITESVLATIRSLCKTSNPDEFASKYTSLITFLNGQGEKDMAEYLERTWSPRVQQWGGFARRNSSVRTNMLIERFHKRLKHEVLNTKANLRIDTLMEILIALVPCMEEERKIMMARGLQVGRSRLTQNHHAHVLAVKLFSSNQDAIKVLENGLWIVTDPRRPHYVEQQFCLCDPKLNNHCRKCGACPYAFLCDCAQDAKAGISCAHIHAALIYAPEGLLTVESEPTSWAAADMSTATTDARQSSENETIYVDEWTGPHQKLYYHRATESTSADIHILQANKELLQEFESVNAALRSKMVSMSKLANERAQDNMKTVIEMMKKMDAEITAELALHRRTHPNGPYLAKRVELPRTGRLPNYTPIRLHKRASLKPKRTHRDQEPVKEMNPDEIQCCIICFRRIPDDGADRDEDEWLKCSSCGFWAHDSCCGRGAPCPYDEGTFDYSTL